MASRLSTLFRYVPRGWLVLWIGRRGSIFAQRASEIRYFVEFIYSIFNKCRSTQTTPIEIGSKWLHYIAYLRFL